MEVFMSAKTKIVVLHMKKIVFTGIAIGLGILILIFGAILLHARSGNTAESEAAPAMYVPGVYTSSVMIDENALDVEVTVDADHINSISLVNLDETTETMYPLVKPSLEELSEQILTNQSVEDVTYSKNNQYTCKLLLDAVSDALEKASLSSEN
jgi:uncharacterized protein with FMN-binding domain